MDNGIIFVIVNIVVLIANICYTQVRIKKEKKYDSRFHFYKILVLDNLKKSLDFIEDIYKGFKSLQGKLGNKPNEEKIKLVEEAISSIERTVDGFRYNILTPSFAFSESLHNKLEKILERYDDFSQEAYANCSREVNNFDYESKFATERVDALRQIRNAVQEEEPKF